VKIASKKIIIYFNKLPYILQHLAQIFMATNEGFVNRQWPTA
jgi:hypothetical protein